MREPGKLAREILPAMRKSVWRRVQMWKAEREIEAILGRNIDGLDDFLDEFAVVMNEPTMAEATRVVKLEFAIGLVQRYCASIEGKI